MEYGKIVFKIDEYLEEKNMSKNQLKEKLNIQRTQRTPMQITK